MFANWTISGVGLSTSTKSFSGVPRRGRSRYRFRPAAVSSGGIYGNRVMTLFLLTFLLFGLFVAVNTTAADTQLITAPTVESTETEQIVPVYQESFDEPAEIPNHPPIDQIPPIPMPEPTDDPKTQTIGRGAPVIYDVATGETHVLETPASVAATGGQTPGYNGGIWPYSIQSGDILQSDSDADGDISILGFNNMYQITGTDQYPWRMNCKVIMHFVDQVGLDRWFVGSGSMIDAETVLTAGHCVYARTAPPGANIFDWAQEIWVYPGWDGAFSQWGPPPSIVNPYGYGKSESLASWSWWTADGDFDGDVGLIRISRAVGMLTSWFGTAWGYGCTEIKSRTYHNASFPAEGCGGGLHTGVDMYYWYGSFDSCPGNQLKINTTGGCYNAGWGGMSGSGAYYMSGDSRWVHAVSSNSNRSTSARYCKQWDDWFNYEHDTFIVGSRTSTFDLQALDTNFQPSSIQVGKSFTLKNFLATNPTNGTGSGTRTYRVYLSTNDNISAGDTLLGTYTFSWSFGTMSSVRVNIGTVTIPSNTPPGSYFVGVILDPSTDSRSSNNDTDSWDATPITVTPCPSQAAPTGVSASDGTYTDRVRVTWSAPSGATKYEVWRNTSSSTGTATRIAHSLTSTYYNDYSAIPGTTYYYRVKASNICGNTSGFSSYNTGYRAPTGTCATPPSYDFTITPSIDWRTISSSFFVQGCHIYRMYLYANMGYDFSLCINDGVGASFTSAGDGDLTMYNSAGTQQWYIDGLSACGFDASTLGTIWEDWSPPSDGYYYLKVSEYLNNQAVDDYDLAYKLNGEHCYDPPSYDYTIEPVTIWQTTGEEFLVPGACRIYKIQMESNKGYDFSLCINDEVGGYCSPGDADMRMYDSSGTQIWYIDGMYSCGFDASTLGTSYESWSPPSDGDYYLKVSEYGMPGAMTYNMAYKMCPVTPVPRDPAPADDSSKVRVDPDLTWKRGTFGVLENTGSGHDDDAVEHINGLSDLSAERLPWSTVANSSGEELWASFDAIYFSVAPAVSDYANLRAAVATGGSLEEFASLGGRLVLNVAGNQGDQSNIAPGGLDFSRKYASHNAETFVSATHPYVTGLGYFGGKPLVESMFDSWGSTDHGTLVNFPAGHTEILENTDGVSMVEYPWGKGKVIVSSLTLGWAAGPEHSAEPLDNQLYYAVDTSLSWVGPTSCTILDDFDRADSTYMGADWTEQNGDFSISSNMATSAGTIWAVMTYADDIGNHLCVDAIHNGLNSVQFVALISGYADLNNNILVKVQDNSSSGEFDRVFFRYGNLGASLGYEDLWPKFTSARMMTHLVGDTITVEFDTNFDGVADQTYSRSGFSTASLGTGSGLGGYNNPLMDNFGIAPAMSASSMASAMSSPAEPVVVSIEGESKVIDAALGAEVQAMAPTQEDIQKVLQSLSPKASEPDGGPWPDTADQGVSFEMIEIGPNANVDKSTMTKLYTGPQVSSTSWSSAVISAAALVSEDFPSADSTVIGSVGFIDSTRIGHFWSVSRGDKVEETFTTGIPSIGQAIFDFYVPTNVLGVGNYVIWDVFINGTKIGDITVMDQQIGPVHVDFSFPPINGPVYTVLFKVTNEVPGGAGSHTLGYAGAHAGTVQLIQSIGKGCDNMDLGHPTTTPSTGSGIGDERSVAVDVSKPVTVTSLGVVVQMALSTDLTVTIREVTGTVRGSIVGSSTIAVTPGGPAFYDVPITFTFEAGKRYDIGFNVPGSWGTSKMEWYGFNNPSLNPALGYDVGPFKVLDGGEWSGSGYGNGLTPHIRACAVPDCSTKYDLYLDTEYPPTTLVAADLTVPTWNPMMDGEILDSCTHYYWQVASRNCCDETTGPIWSFDTELVSDLHKDLVINFFDYAKFALAWLDDGCSAPNWCNGTDLNYSGEVDEADLDIFARQWLTVCLSYDDTTAAAIAAMEYQMSSSKIDASDGNDFMPGTYFIYKTNRGRYGKFIVRKLNKLDNNKLTIDWVTYNANGSVYSSGKALEIRGTWSCDLDKGVETSSTLDRDWAWVMVSKTTRYLLPTNHAKFKLMYRP